MFGWFGPTCPCDPAAKRWVESRLQWLTQQFGLHILLERPIILPTPEFFPDPWDGSPKAVRAMFRRVCGYMGVDPDDLEKNPQKAFGMAVELVVNQVSTDRQGNPVMAFQFRPSKN